MRSEDRRSARGPDDPRRSFRTRGVHFLVPCHTWVLLRDESQSQGPAPPCARYDLGACRALTESDCSVINVPAQEALNAAKTQEPVSPTAFPVTFQAGLGRPNPRCPIPPHTPLAPNRSDDYGPSPYILQMTMMNTSKDIAATEQEEEVEGLGNVGDLQIDDYPLDDIMVRSETRTVSEVVKRIKSDRFFMAPDFQRDFVWEPARQSKLIESCIMRIPLPVLYVAEGNDGRIIVVDGLQRLTTFVRFINNDLKLTLGKDHPLHGKLYSDLPINLQERVEDTQLTLYILDKNAPQRAKLDIFERVNSGSVLTRQQMRNALYNGPGTRWLQKMASRNEFLRATGGSLNNKTMRDREAVNRFAAFHIFGAEAYDGGDMDDFLARSIELLNDRDEAWLKGFGSRFRLSMNNNYVLFERHAFRKSLASDQERRSLINISLFDVMSTMLSVTPKAVVDNNADEILGRVVELLNDATYANTITYSTNSTSQVKARFRMTMDALGDFQELEFLR